MKNILAIFLGLSLALVFAAPAEARTVKVHSYYKPSTHTYVNSYYKTSQNKTKLDNFSTKGNINPFTGKKGYVNPYR